jgi:type IV secretory pathway VirB4 component
VVSPEGAQFEAQRGITFGPSVREYPGSKWANIAGYLIDKRRQELFTGEETHFVNRYYLTLTRQLRSDIYAKTNSLLYKKRESNSEQEGYFNFEVCRQEIQEFRDETDACISHLVGRIYILYRPAQQRRVRLVYPYFGE